MNAYKFRVDILGLIKPGEVQLLSDDLGQIGISFRYDSGKFTDKGKTQISGILETKYPVRTEYLSLVIGESTKVLSSKLERKVSVSSIKPLK